MSETISVTSRRRDLRSYLWQIGRQVKTRSTTGRLRTTALALSSGAVAVALILLTMALSAAQDREEHMRRLLPIPAESATNAAALYTSALPSLTDATGVPRTVDVIWVLPLQPDAAPPPGLPRWPKAGEVFVSPRLLTDLANHPPDLFGTVVGTIQVDGLEEPGERRAYIGALSTTADVWTSDPRTVPISGFGEAGMPGFWGVPTLNATPKNYLVLSAVGLLLLPALIALVLGTGLDAERRRQRTRQLRALGASRVHLAWVDLAESWPAAAAGSLAAAAMTSVLLITGATATQLDLLVPAEQMRTWWPQLVGALLVGHALTVAIILLASTLRSTRRNPSPQQRAQKPQLALSAVCLAAAAAAMWIPANTHTAFARVFGYHIPVFIVILTLPALLGTLFVGIGTLGLSYGLRRGSPSAILGGRRLRSFPIHTARLLGGITGIILLVGQAQLNASALGTVYAQALADSERYGNVVMSASGTVYDAEMTTFLTHLPPEATPVWTSLDDATATANANANANVEYRITGPCPSLRALGLACETTTKIPSNPNKKLSALIAATSFGGFTSTRIEPVESPRQDELKRTAAQLSLISTTEQDLPVDAIQRLAYHNVTGGLNLSSFGEEGLSAGTDVRVRQAWVVFWGIIGMLPLIAVTTIFLAADALTSARDTAPLAAMFDRRRWLSGLSIWRIALPLTTAGIVAALAYLILPVGMTRYSENFAFFTSSPTYAWASAIGCASLSALLTLWSARHLSAAASHWRPGHDN